MITLEVNPAVLQALKAAFPSAQCDSAERALGKYVQVLTQLSQPVGAPGTRSASGAIQFVLSAHF